MFGGDIGGLLNILRVVIPLEVVDNTQLLQLYEENVESCKHESFNPTRNNLSILDNLMFTSYEDNNCFNTQKLL